MFNEIQSIHFNFSIKMSLDRELLSLEYEHLRHSYTLGNTLIGKKRKNRNIEFDDDLFVGFTFLFKIYCY